MLLLGSVSGVAMMLAFAPSALAQTTINDARTAPVETDGEDVTIDTGGSITIENAGPALTLNSDNDLSNAGTINIEDVDNAVGVSLEGGADRNYTQSGTINVNETFEVANSPAPHLLKGMSNSPQAPLST